MYFHDEVGFNSRLDALQAAVLSAKLPHLAGVERKRARERGVLRRGASPTSTASTTPFVDPANESIFNQYTIRADRRDALQAFLKERGIGNSVYYPLPLHLQPCFAYLGYKRGQLSGVGARGERSGVAADLSRADRAQLDEVDRGRAGILWPLSRRHHERHNCCEDPGSVRRHRRDRAWLRRLAAGRRVREGRLPRHRLRRQRARRRRCSWRGESHIQDVPASEVAALVRSGAFEATTDETRLAEADAISIAVPTPLSKTRDPDMSYVHLGGRDGDASGASGHARRAREHDLSRHDARSPAARADEAWVSSVGKDVFVAFSPERVDPGNPVYHTKNTPKVVGGITPACTELATALYDELHRHDRAGLVAGSGRAGQAAREHVPRGQHRPRQRDGDRVRQARRRRVGSHRRRRHEAVRLHEVHAGARHRRALHSARPALSRVEDAHAELQDALHRPGERDQQPDAGSSSSRRSRTRSTPSASR